jgi:DNA-binding transcriptional ArsR family regulator
LRLSSYPNGVLAYHLLVLENGNKVRVDRKRNKITRYYLVGIPSEDSDIINCLRNKVTRGLIIFMIYHVQCTFSELVESSGKAPSTISWHLKWLKKARIVSTLVGEGRHLYGVVNSREVKKILWAYKDAFIDNVVENYVEIIDKL